MRGAAAALAGAVLFFLGVLSVAGDADRVRPPAAIPLGVDADGQPAPDGTPAPAPAPGVPDTDATSATSATSAISPRPAPAAPSTPPAGEEPPPAGGSGGVEKVQGELDCYQVGTGDADGRCPPGQARKIDDPSKEKGSGDGRN